MVKFKVGDKVIAKKKTPYSQATDGWIGTVDKVRNSLDEDIYVKGKNKAGYPIEYWVDSDYFNLYSDAFEAKQIVVERTNAKTVEATAFTEGGDIIAKAKAKCSPEDKWDFYFGANLAVERLEKIVEKKKEKATSFNAEMVCIKNESCEYSGCFTVGKIYKVTKGTFECNHGGIPSVYQNRTDYDCKKFKSVEEINAADSDIQFIEIVK